SLLNDIFWTFGINAPLHQKKYHSVTRPVKYLSFIDTVYFTHPNPNLIKAFFIPRKTVKWPLAS
ncbi:hypothetical protein, partial [Chitinophaga tropicalis]|uniref:hypothetical protein n=1 Tax=Chitinophaga tropicalis TaxID=2683588 RepID=UPI001E5870C4